MANDDLQALGRADPDTHQPGIIYRNITTLLLDGPGFAASIARTGPACHRCLT